MAVFRVEKTGDYTIMSNHHFKNKELSLKAKGLLSLMLSLPEDWDYTLVGLSVINKEGVDAIREALKELEKFGYVERRRARNEGGQLKGTEYIIHEQPILGKPMLENPTLENPTLEKPMLGKPTQENPTQLNTYRSKTNPEKKKESNTDVINNSSNLISSLNPYSCECGNVENSDEMRKDEKRNNKHNNYDYWKGQIQTNLDYESLKISYPYDLKLIDEIVEIMVETVMSIGDTIQIASNKYPHSVVKERFLNVDYGHMQYIIDCFNDGARNKEIKNIKQYLKAVIFNAPTTIDSYYTAKVRYDMPWLGQKHDG